MWNEYVRKLGVYLLQVIEENNSQRGKEMLKTRIKKQAAKERGKSFKKEETQADHNKCTWNKSKQVFRKHLCGSRAAWLNALQSSLSEDHLRPKKEKKTLHIRTVL